MCFERIAEERDRPVHDVFVEHPLKETAVDHATNPPDCLPEDLVHQVKLRETLQNATDNSTVAADEGRCFAGHG
jgi:hypothetical protein